MNNTDLETLRAFRVLMAERSVSRAAQRLNLSQPAMSHTLAKLRALFGDPLLSRGRGGMVPTERALQIEESVKDMIEAFDRLVAPAGPFRPEDSSRTFVLTATEYSEMLLLPRFMARLQAVAPKVCVEIRAPDQDRLPEWLETGEVDLRIGWLRDVTPTLRSQVLFQDRLVCVARSDHPAIAGSLTLEQFFTLPHARPQVIGRGTTGRVIDDAVAARGRKLRIALSVQNFLTVPSVVAHSDLIATLPLLLARAFVPQLPLRILEPPVRLPRMRYSAFWHDRSHNDVGHQWFRRLLAATAKDMQKQRSA